MRSVLVAVVVALATALHASVWLFMHERVSPPNASGVLSSVSFSPINPSHNGEVDKTTEKQIRSDLAALAPYTRAVRTYSVSNGLDLVPQLASAYGLRVTLGVWINDWEQQNEREIETAITLTKHYRNVESIIVGNETIFRAQAEHRNNPLYNANETVRDLIAKIQRVKREVSVPVTTAEVPNVWLEYPQLASSVDYIAVHILPYWEGLPGSAARDPDPADPGRGGARLHPPRRRSRHRLLDRRGVRSAVEDERGKRRALLGHLQCRPPSEIFLRRNGRRTELHVEGDRGARHRRLAVDPDLRHPAHYRGASYCARAHRECHRRLVRQCRRLLGHPLFRARLAGCDVRRGWPARPAHHDHEAPGRGACRHYLRRQAGAIVGAGGGCAGGG